MNSGRFLPLAAAAAMCCLAKPVPAGSPMALHVRHPSLILSAQPGAWTFSILFSSNRWRALRW